MTEQVQTRPDEAGYNGWANYQTWCVFSWAINDEERWEGFLEEGRDVLRMEETSDVEQRWRLGRMISLRFRRTMPGMLGVWEDLMASALDEIQWEEIARHVIEGL